MVTRFRITSAIGWLYLIMGRNTWMFVLCACGEVTGPSTQPDAGLPGDTNVDASTTIDAGDSLGPWSTPARIDQLSTAGNVDSYATIRADGCELFFVSDRDTGNQDIYVSSRFSITDPWGAPTRITELSTTTTESGPEISADGRTIWFARNTSAGGYDLFVATRTSPTAPWSTPDPIVELDTAASERAPELSSDGKTMWFVRHNGADYDIYVATRPSLTSPWENIKPVVRFESTAEDENPTATGDEQVMYFDSLRDGTRTMYTSTRSGGPWSVPVAIPELADAYRADVTPDNRYMVLSKTGLDGSSDLYETRR